MNRSVASATTGPALRTSSSARTEASSTSSQSVANAATAGIEIVAEGVPETVAKEPRSFTGKYLAPLLSKREAVAAE